MVTRTSCRIPDDVADPAGKFPFALAEFGAEFRRRYRCTYVIPISRRFHPYRFMMDDWCICRGAVATKAGNTRGRRWIRYRPWARQCCSPKARSTHRWPST